MGIMEWKFTCSGDPITVARVVGAAKGEAFLRDLKMEVQGDREAFGSHYRMTVIGSEEALKDYKCWAECYTSRILSELYPRIYLKEKELKEGILARLQRWCMERDSRRPIDISGLPLFSNQGRDSEGRLMPWPGRDR